MARDVNNQWLFEGDIVTLLKDQVQWTLRHLSQKNGCSCEMKKWLKRQSWTDNSAGLASTFASNEVDVPHQLLLVSPADGNFHLSHLHGILEGVDVLDAAQIDNKLRLTRTNLSVGSFWRRSFNDAFTLYFLSRTCNALYFPSTSMYKMSSSGTLRNLLPTLV